MTRRFHTMVNTGHVGDGGESDIINTNNVSFGLSNALKTGNPMLVVVGVLLIPLVLQMLVQLFKSIQPTLTRIFQMEFLREAERVIEFECPVDRGYWWRATSKTTGNKLILLFTSNVIY